LEAPPFEYIVLRATPEPWQPEDSILTLLAMFNTLQGRQALFEQSMEESPRIVARADVPIPDGCRFGVGHAGDRKSLAGRRRFRRRKNLI
jgi:hypothetical protein